MRSLRGLLLVFVLLPAGSVPARAGIVPVPAGESVSAGVVASRSEKCTYGAHKDHDMSTRDVALGTGTLTYGIRYNACVDKAHGDRAAWIEGYLGMPMPSSANWYHSGFLFLSVNGEDAGTYRPTYFGPSEAAKRGAADVVWSLPAARVRARFVLPAGENALFAEIRLEPKQPVKSLGLRLQCFPSAFTSWEKILGDRILTTPIREEHQNPWDARGEKRPEPRTVALNPAQESWLFFADSVCDPAAGKGAGPCAVMFLPAQVKEAATTLTDYPVSTGLSFDPSTTSIRLLFWDFAGWKNADALKYLRANAGRCRQALESLDFTNQQVAELLDGKRELELTALAREAGSAAIGPEAAAYLEQVGQALAHARETRKAGGAVPIEDESALLALLRKEATLLEPLRWKLLFAD